MIYKDDIDFDIILAELKKDQTRKVRTKNVDILDRYQNKYFKKYKSDQQRLLWDTKNNMTCGFIVSQRYIDFSLVKSFIDVGCGTGNYFNEILSKYKKIKTVVGVDAVPNFIEISKEKNKEFDITYVNDNIFNIPNNTQITSYDLCTCNGVLQTLDLSSISDVFSVLNKVTNSGGQLWVTALNYYKLMHHYWSSDNRRFVGLWKYKFEELIYYIKDDFHDIQYGFYNPDSTMENDKTKADFVFVHATKN